MFGILLWTAESRGEASLCTEGLNIEDILLYEGEFFFIGGVGVVPLFYVRQAVAKGTVTGHLAVLSEAARGHEGGPQCDALIEPVRIDAKIYDMPLGIEGHFVHRTQTLFNQVPGQLAPEVRGPRGLLHVGKL